MRTGEAYHMLVALGGALTRGRIKSDAPQSVRIIIGYHAWIRFRPPSNTEFIIFLGFPKIDKSEKM